MVGNTLLSRERNASLVYSTNAVGANYDFVSNNIDAQASLIQSLNAPVPDYASVAAFAWEPATMSGMMGGSYSWNSSGAENMVQHDMNTGVYTVTFPNLASLPIGVAHVSAYNGNHHCMVDSINASGADIQVVVRCFNTAGATGDGAFTIAYVSRQGQTGEESAYMTSQLPSNECTPALYGRSWASHGGSAVAWRIPGWSPSPNDGYEVYFPKQKSFQNNPRMFGTFEVTGFGSSNQYCTGLQFYDSQRSVAVDVACWNPGGNVADAPFSVTFAQGSPNGTPSYLWLRSEDVNSPYFPTPNYAGNQYGWNADHPLGQSAITTLLGTGQYKVDIPELRPWSASNAIVTAYGYSGSYCNVGWWTSSSMFSGGSEVRVNCYNASGALQNVTFQLVYSTN
jgi:hypothetical protein